MDHKTSQEIEKFFFDLFLPIFSVIEVINLFPIVHKIN